MNSELVLIEPKNAMQIFTATQGLDPFLEKIKAEIDSFVSDISTEKGRKEVASMAYKVSQSKSYIEKMGKELVDELKRKPKLIDAERKRVKLILDGWRDDVRKPLTDWEDNEKARTEKHYVNMEKIKKIGMSHTTGMDSEFIRGLLTDLEVIIVDDTWEEFEESATILHNDAEEALKFKLKERIKYEEEQAELEKFRKEKAARDKKEEEDRIAREAADRAKKDAEEKAAKEKEKSELRERELKLKAENAEREKRESEERARRESEEAKLKVEREKIEAEEKADREKKQAIENERKRVAEEDAKNKKAEEERQRDVDHRRVINRNILDSMTLHGIDESLAKKIITLAAQGELGELVVRY